MFPIIYANQLTGFFMMGNISCVNELTQSHRLQVIGDLQKATTPLEQ